MPLLHCLDTRGSAFERPSLRNTILVAGQRTAAEVSLANDSMLSHEYFAGARGGRRDGGPDLGATNGTWVNGSEGASDDGWSRAIAFAPGIRTLRSNGASRC